MSDGYYHHVEIQEPRDAGAVVHDGRHTDCPPCFAIKVKTVSFAASAMQNRSPEAARLVKDEKALVKNLDSYKALKDSGVQPASVGRAHELEQRATTKAEIVTGEIARSPQYAKTLERALVDTPIGKTVT